jgi:membrane protein required for beta-lactamase induction
MKHLRFLGIGLLTVAIVSALTITALLAVWNEVWYGFGACFFALLVIAYAIGEGLLEDIQKLLGNRRD